MNPIRILAAGLLLVPAVAAAHVTVWPKESTVKAWEKYEIRVPNEKQVDTIAVEVRFPAGVRAMSFEQKPGWMTEPVRDTSGKTVGVRWTGKLPPQQFAEFGIIAVNPATPGELKWTATQTYADRTSVDWSGDKSSKTPAPRVTIKAAAAGN
jgi:uncharacterized protein YcnI